MGIIAKWSSIEQLNVAGNKAIELGISVSGPSPTVLVELNNTRALWYKFDLVGSNKVTSKEVMNDYMQVFIVQSCKWLVN